MKNLEKDIKVQQAKVEDIAIQQQRAIEKEDYEEADTLNVKLTQTKQLITSKEIAIRMLDEEYMALENKKGEKFADLSMLINKSLNKIE